MIEDPEVKEARSRRMKRVVWGVSLLASATLVLVVLFDAGSWEWRRRLPTLTALWSRSPAPENVTGEAQEHALRVAVALVLGLRGDGYSGLSMCWPGRLVPCPGAQVGWSGWLALREEFLSEQPSFELPDGTSGLLAEGAASRFKVPAKPYKWQKPPPCSAEAAEEDVNGGCWVWIGRTAPCPSLTFEHASKCYRPVSRDKVPSPPPQSEHRDVED